MPKGKTHSYNVLFSPEEFALLEELKTKTGLAGGVLVRAAVKYMHAHVYLGAPTCASGAACFVPQMHAGRIGPNSAGGGLPL